MASHDLIAQYSLSGKTKDAQTGKPIPFVNVWITGSSYGTSTNIDGDFEMKIGTKWLGQGHTISLSSIGYNSQQLTLDQMDLSANQLINLEPTATSLSEVVIQGKRKKKEVKQARLLVQKALAKIPKNYVAQPYLANTFYRHYCSENDDYVRLIEAALDIYSPRNNFEYRTLPDDRLAFKVTQLRRSFDFTESAKVYHPSISINYLLSNDFTSFDYHNPLKSELSDYDFYISDTTYLDQEPVIRVQFEPNQGPEQTGKITYSGTLFILENDLAFIRAEIEEVKNKRLLTDSIYSATGKIVTFKEYRNKYYLDRVTSDLRV
ncbi:MAG: carboxypeptidase-like regulatory domain-containing protein, partial [Cyclobacteriaceae bacterium]